MMKRFYLAPLALGALALGACGDDTDSSEPMGLDWRNLDQAARTSYMTSTVLPRFTTIFQEFDAQTYASVTCFTCHSTTRFSMPNPDLPGLPADLTSVFQNNPTVANFMANTVVPEMAALLELTPADMSGQGDITCFSCHPSM